MTEQGQGGAEGAWTRETPDWRPEPQGLRGGKEEAKLSEALEEGRGLRGPVPGGVAQWGLEGFPFPRTPGAVSGREGHDAMGRTTGAGPMQCWEGGTPYCSRHRPFRPRAQERWQKGLVSNQI